MEETGVGLITELQDRQSEPVRLVWRGRGYRKVKTVGDILRTKGSQPDGTVARECQSGLPFPWKTRWSDESGRRSS